MKFLTSVVQKILHNLISMQKFQIQIMLAKLRKVSRATPPFRTVLSENVVTFVSIWLFLQIKNISSTLLSENVVTFVSMWLFLQILLI